MPPTPPTTPRSQTSNPVACTPNPNTTPPTPPSSPPFSTPASVDATYQIVCIKTTNTDWLVPGPRDRVQIIGPVFKGDDAVFDDKEETAAAEEEDDDDDFEIPCAAHLTLGGDRSIHLNSLYYPSTALFTDKRGCADKTAKMVDEADRVSSVGITMQDTIFCEEERGDDEMVESESEDVRDDNGNPFLVLHVNRGLGASARLYCKKIPDSRNGLMDDGFVESLGLYKWRRDGRWGECGRTKELER